MNATDILLTDEDLNFSGGDFFVGDSDTQHIEHILRAEKGNYSQFPTVGAGIEKNQNGTESDDQTRRNIMLELQRDGYNVASVQVQNGQISIDAERIK